MRAWPKLVVTGYVQLKGAEGWMDGVGTRGKDAHRGARWVVDMNRYVANVQGVAG